MFKIFKKDKVKNVDDSKPLLSTEQSNPASSESVIEQPVEKSIGKITEVVVSTANKSSWFNRLKKGLVKTRHNFSSGIGQLFKSMPKLDDETLEELETLLLLADVGVEATQHIIDSLIIQAKTQKVHEGEDLVNCLKTVMINLLSASDQPLIIPEQNSPFIILMAGINGAGKTTTIGKLAKQLQAQGKSVMLAAGDTFRAAAIEQLQAWGESNNVPVVAQHSGADSASVIYDAVQSATAKNIDVLIADTAGRLHTQQSLMGELEKVKRVIQKFDSQAPHETMLVLDASIGQNALQQAKEFSKAVDISGITMTKLDGTAKGGILFAIAQQLQIPVRFIGVGESVEDLQVFSASAFVEAIFTND